MTDTIWTEETRVKTYETDFRCQWKPACFFQAMQEAASDHASHLGFDYHMLLARNQAWVLSRAKVIFDAYPKSGQPVFVRTWPKGIQQRVFFMRDFIFTDAAGRQLASATTAFLLIDTQARRLLLPSALG